MTPSPWRDAYYGDLQSLFSLLVIPVAFLAFRLAVPTDPARAAVPRAASLVAGATLLFAFETMLDPIATGPLLRSEALRDSLATTLVPFLFVYLGDFRVLFVALGVAEPGAPLRRLLGRAAAATALVPVATGVLHALLRLVFPQAHDQWLWMIYEAGFLLLCVFAADVLIVVAGLDLGWAIRMVPNQLYYAFWAPFVSFRFFSRAPSDAPANAAR